MTTVISYIYAVALSKRWTSRENKFTNTADPECSFVRKIEKTWHDVFDRVLFTLQISLSLHTSTCQALKFWVNNMSVDDYHLRHLQGSCCNWLSHYCLSCPLELQDFPRPPLSHYYMTKVQKERQIEQKLDCCYCRDLALCVTGFPHSESYIQRRWRQRKTREKCISKIYLKNK